MNHDNHKRGPTIQGKHAQEWRSRNSGTCRCAMLRSPSKRRLIVNKQMHVNDATTTNLQKMLSRISIQERPAPHNNNILAEAIERKPRHKHERSKDTDAGTT